MIVIYNTRPCWLASYGKSLTACESGPLEAVETCQGSRQEGILLALDVEGSHSPLRISLPSCRWWKAACFCPPRGAVPLVEAAGLSTAVREVPENAVTMFFLPISTSLPVRLTKRRGLREAYRRALPLRESETSVVGASSFVVPAGAAQNAQSKSTGGAQEALQGEHEICLRTSSTKTAAVAACERVHALLPVFCDFWVIGSVFG